MSQKNLIFKGEEKGMDSMTAMTQGLSRLGHDELCGRVRQQNRIDQLLQDIRDIERSILGDEKYEELRERYKT